MIRFNRLPIARLAALALLSGALAAPARADDIRFGEPAYGGTGCPAGTGSAVVSPDGHSLSLLFDEYEAEAGGATGRSVDTKSCNIAIPVHVPQGYSVSVLSLPVRGFLGLPRGARATASVETFFAGQAGPRYSRQFRGPRNEDYLLANPLAAGALTWSPCGADVILRANTSVTVEANRRGEQALATMSFGEPDGSGALIQLQWKRCGAAAKEHAVSETELDSLLGADRL